MIPLLKNRFEVFAVDLPGQGESSAVPQYDTLFVAKVMQRLFDHLSPGTYDLVGHDVGVGIEKLSNAVVTKLNAQFLDCVRRAVALLVAAFLS